MAGSWGVALHGGAHAGAASSGGAGLDPTYAVASLVLVGGLGGLLYWYYGVKRAASAQPQSAKQ